ncbi:MAG: hypothetical protein WCH46_05475 [bacterium]
MTQHDQISSYIDNELSPEQEQDFLISLASSDGLRKSFRSELILKNVIHRDEVLTTPSRNMRSAVLTTLGITGVAALASETADAASVAPVAKATILKTMFASKVGALVTASMVTVSVLSGYGIHSLTAIQPTQKTELAPSQHIVQPTTSPVVSTPASVSEVPQTQVVATKQSTPTHHKVTLKAIQPPSSGTTQGGINQIGVKLPKTDDPK